MKQKATFVVLFVLVLTFAVSKSVSGQSAQKAISATTPDQVKWFTPSYYKDGRERAHMFGDSDSGGDWIDRARLPAGMIVPAHTHTMDEFVTVIQGTWYVGEGEKFDAAKLRAYPAGSFLLIPAGLPHFVSTKDGPVIIQISGHGVWTTEYFQK